MRFIRRFGWMLLLSSAVAPWVRAQLPFQSAQGAPTREEATDDPLGRSTPRGTLLGFIKAVERGDYDQAVNYLDTKERSDLARELAQQLKIVLDRETSIDLDKLSARPEGDWANSRGANRDLVGVAKTSTGSVGIYLDRVQHGDNPPIWLFSRETLLRVPEIYQDIGTPAIERYLPDWVKAKPFFSLPLWRWGIALISIPLILLLGSLFGRLLKPVLELLAQRFTGAADTHQVQSLAAPLRIVLFGLLFVIGSGYSYTLLGRQFWRNLGTVLIVVGAVWLLTRLINIGGELTIGRLKRLQASDKIALAGLLERSSQIVVFTAGALVILYLAGVNLTAALTGLGIGGLAVAFAAQKTLENLFGGIMIIWDRPVRIGDACRIGDVTGMVVDIGLRSTRIRTPDRTIVTIPNGQLATMNLENYTLRDKFWFHPTIALRYETTTEQMQIFLVKTREMLDKHPSVESETARVRFIRLENTSQDVEVFAYVFAAGYADFLAIQEDLLLRILEIVESAGTALAVPTQAMYLMQDSDPHARRMNERVSSARER